MQGDQATWSGKAMVPFPVTLKFDVTLDGDTFARKADTSPFGTFNVTGVPKGAATGVSTR